MRIFLAALRIIGHLWSLPNTILALALGFGGKYALDRPNRVIVAENGAVSRLIHRLGFAGMCIGDVVICPYNLRLYAPAVYRHELVHATQARIFGPFYLPLTLIGYVFGALIYPPSPHDASPLEVWADAASGNADHNRYLRFLQRKKGRGS